MALPSSGNITLSAIQAETSTGSLNAAGGVAGVTGGGTYMTEFYGWSASETIYDSGGTNLSTWTNSGGFYAGTVTWGGNGLHFSTSPGSAKYTTTISFDLAAAGIDVRDFSTITFKWYQTGSHSWSWFNSREIYMGLSSGSNYINYYLVSEYFNYSNSSKWQSWQTVTVPAISTAYDYIVVQVKAQKRYTTIPTHTVYSNLLLFE